MCVCVCSYSVLLHVFAIKAERCEALVTKQNHIVDDLICCGVVTYVNLALDIKHEKQLIFQDFMKP